MRPSVVKSGLAVLLCSAFLVACGPDDSTAPADVAPAQGAADLIPRESFFGNPTRLAPTLSPDGSQIAYLAPVDGVMNIWVGSAEAIDRAEPVTQEVEAGIGRVTWSANGAYVIFSKGAGKEYGWHVFATEIATGITKDVTPMDSKDAVAHFYKVNPLDPDAIIVGMNDRDPRYYDVYSVSLGTGERELIMKNQRGEDSGFIEIHLDNNNVPRLAIETTEDGGGDLLLSADGQEWNVIRHINAIDIFPFYIKGFSADNTVAYIVSSRDRNTSAIYALNLEDGSQKLIGANDRADVEEVIIHPQTNELEAFAVEYDREEWATASPAIAKTLAFIARAASGDFHVVSRSHDGNKWIVFYDQVTAAGDYYLIDAAAYKAQFLFSSRPDLNDARLAKMYPRIIKARDGLDLVSYLTLPVGSDVDKDGRPDAPLPTVLLVHNGPWGPRDRFGYNPRHQWLANRGYAVLSVNFRGSLGFGKAFVEAGTNEMGGKMQDDLVDAVNWAVATDIADAKKVAIVGDGYGGYAAMMGLTRTPETYACGVNTLGVPNLLTLYDSFPKKYEPILEATWYRRVGDPRKEGGVEKLKALSPFYSVDKITKPLLMTQGDMNTQVSEAESEQIVETLQENGVPVTYLFYKGEAMKLGGRANETSLRAITEAFLANCLGGQFEPIDDALVGSSLEVRAGADEIPGLQAALEAERAASE